MVGIEPTQPQEQPEDQSPEEPEEDDETGRFDAWRRRSAIGGVATGLALGLQDIFYPSQREPVITAEAPGDPPDADQRLRVVLDPDDPTKSVAILPDIPAPVAPPDDPD